MKVYFYMIISLGIMLTLGIAGVEGIGNNLLGIVINNDTIVQPTTQYGENVSSDPQAVLNEINDNSNNLWTKILIALIAMGGLVILTGIQVVGSGLNFNPIDLVVSGVSVVIFGFVVSDMWTLVNLFFSYDTNWISYFVLALISVYLVGFAISILEFIRGTD